MSFCKVESVQIEDTYRFCCFRETFTRLQKSHMRFLAPVLTWSEWHYCHSSHLCQLSLPLFSVSSPPQELSVCLPESSFTANCLLQNLLRWSTLSSHTHTYGAREKETGPISISVSHFNPRESWVVSGFSLCKSSFHETCFSSIQENFCKEKLQKFFFFFFPHKKNFTSHQAAKIVQY